MVERLPLSIRALVCALMSILIFPRHAASEVTAAVTYKFVDLYKLDVPSGFTGFLFSYPPGMSGNAVAGRGTLSGGSGAYSALVWNGTSSPVNLNPSGFTSSFAQGVGGGQQVGYAMGSQTNGKNHAFLWSSSSSSAVDLHPVGMLSSEAYGTDGTNHVGFGVWPSPNRNNALLWTGNTVIDLGTDLRSSLAYSVSGGEQVGIGYVPASGYSHAILWHGTSSYIDLHPSDFVLSQGFGTDGEYQVGSARNLAGNDHAYLWHGSSAGVDLNPPGANSSDAFAVRNGIQVGRRNINAATAWYGTNSAIFLDQMMAPNFLNPSQATSIDAFGNIYGLARASDGSTHAVAWTVPEPTGMSLFAIAALGLLRRFRPAIGDVKRHT